MKSPRSHQVSASHSPVWPRRWHSIVQFVDQGLSPTGAEFGGRLPPVEFWSPCRRQQQQRERGQDPPHNAQPGSGKSRTSQRAAPAVLRLTVTAGKIRAAETEL
jgi:hypothetical protein